MQNSSLHLSTLCKCCTRNWNSRVKLLRSSVDMVSLYRRDLLPKTASRGGIAAKGKNTKNTRQLRFSKLYFNLQVFPRKTADYFLSNRFGYLHVIRRLKRFSFHSLSHSLGSFGSFENLKLLLYSYCSTKQHDFPLKSSHFELPQFSSSPTVTSLVLFPKIYRQFSRSLDDYEGQKVALVNVHYL